MPTTWTTLARPQRPTDVEEGEVGVSLLDRISARSRGEVERRYSTDQWITDYLLPSQFQYGGNGYPFGLNQTYANTRIQEISQTLPGYLQALRQSPPAFAAQMVRALVLSQVRFTFRNLPSSGTPRRTFGTRELSALERPWPNATTGELVSRMEWHAGLAGNAYVHRQPKRLRVLRPDWVMIVYGSHQEPEDAAHALDGEILGYAYCNGGFTSGNTVQTILPPDMAHWSPIPDPERAGVGMSWITPAVREIQGDIAATEHKVQFFKNGATPNMVVKGIPAATKDQFNEIVDAIEENHTGVRNAYRTLYLTAGSDATVVGSHLAQIDFKSTQGTGETRISVLSRVPAAILGISEGLSGSSLNAGNFNAARRMFADSWVYPTLQDLSAALAPLLNVPSDAELWFDPADMVALREDAKDAAEIFQMQMSTIVSGVNGGFEPKSVVAATVAQDPNLLKHSGRVSVQLQEPGAPPTGAPPASDAGPKALPQTRAVDEGDELDEDTLALLTALNELDDEERAAGPDFNLKHPRGPGGRFRTVVDRLKDALHTHLAGTGNGDPFKDFNREQLRKVAKVRGIELKRGEDRDSIAKKLLESLKGDESAKHEGPPKAAKKAAPEVPSPPSVGRRAAGKDISGDVDFASMPASYNPKTNENDALKAIIGRQGFDGKPRVVSREDFDAALGRGEVRETWRGLYGPGAGTYAEQFRTGELRAGLGINGDGTYVALNKADGEYYGSTLLRIGLAKNAKVISADDLDRRMDAHFAQLDRRRKSAELKRLDAKLLKDLAAARTPRDRANIRRKYRDNVFGLDSDRSIALQRDPGIFAALRGYDAIEIPKERSPDKHHEMIILNRTATIVQEA